MTDVAVIQEGLPLVNIRTGELVNPLDVEQVVALMVDLREYKREIDTAISAAQAAFLAEAERIGAATLRVGKFTATVSKPTEIVWDVYELLKLLDAGLPSERYAELVTETVETKVDAVVAKQIAAANPEYRAIVERARTDVPRPQRVSVRPA